MLDSRTYQLIVAVQVAVFQRGPRAAVAVETIRRHEMICRIVAARFADNRRGAVVLIMESVGSLPDNLRVC